MKKITFAFLVLTLLFLPIFINADENELLELISQTTKYYKTVIYPNYSLNLSTSNENIISQTIEISKEEYDNSDLHVTDTTIETTYKKLSSSIFKKDNYYRYKAVLTWKTMPSVKSYDIIAIGFYQSVKIKNNNLYFTQDYCLSSGKCSSTSSNYPQVFAGGAGTSFKLQSGSLSSLSQTLYFDIEKNTTGTITSQLVSADYAHATGSISLANSKKFTVNSNGITLNGVSSYYDNMNAAKTYWSGSW